MESQSFHMSLTDCKSVTGVYRANMSKQKEKKSGLIYVITSQLPYSLWDGPAPCAYVSCLRVCLGVIISKE